MIVAQCVGLYFSEMSYALQYIIPYSTRSVKNEWNWWDWWIWCFFFQNFSRQVVASGQDTLYDEAVLFYPAFPPDERQIYTEALTQIFLRLPFPRVGISWLH